MSIVPLLLFCSLALVVGAIVLFVFSARQGDCHEAERLCLLPLEDDADVRPGPGEPPHPSPEILRDSHESSH
ncbi:MAG: cytochrome oxidase [Planctomycetes bacterium]|nr:cytochrome oxidase [Planctomycetota bacterium]